MRNPLTRLARFLGIKGPEKIEPKLLTAVQTRNADEAIVRLLLPNAWFRKRGPGVTASTRKVFFDDLTSAQRLAAVDRGWVPACWLGLDQARTDAITRSLPRARRAKR